MCKHDFINIQHAYCSLVCPNHSVQKVGLWVWVHWPTMGIPTCHLKPSPRLYVGYASISWAAMLSCLGLCKSSTSIKLEVYTVLQHRQRRTEPWPFNMHKNLVKIGCVFPEICSWTDKDTHRQTRSSQYSLPYWRRSNNNNYNHMPSQTC